MNRTAPLRGASALASPPRLRRGPRMLRLRPDKPLHEADTLQQLESLLHMVVGANR